MAIAPSLDMAPQMGALANIEAEQALLGIALFDNAAIPHADGLIPEAFYEPFHSRMWAAIAKESAARRADAYSVFEAMRGDPTMEAMGGLRYFADLVDMAPPADAAETYAQIIHDLFLRRSLFDICREATADIGSARLSAYERLSATEKAIMTLATGAAPIDSNLVGAHDAANDALAEIDEEAQHGRPKGHMTGLRCIDRRLGGLRSGRLVVVAGRPSMGKSALAIELIKGAAERNPSLLFPMFSLEMRRREIVDRLFSAASHESEPSSAIAYQNMSGDKLTPFDQMRLRDLKWKLPANLIIDDASSVSVDYVRRRIYALRRKAPIGAVVVDYLQIMELGAHGGKNLTERIGEVTSALKRLARSSECCIVLLSQLSRGVESRDDKRPQLSDLRDSGSIEQDADAVLFPYREYYYVERAEPRQGTPEHIRWVETCDILRRAMDVLCSKNRGGAVGADRQEYYAEFNRVCDMPRDDRWGS